MDEMTTLRHYHAGMCTAHHIGKLAASHVDRYMHSWQVQTGMAPFVCRNPFLFYSKNIVETRASFNLKAPTTWVLPPRRSGRAIHRDSGTIVFVNADALLAQALHLHVTWNMWYAFMTYWTFSSNSCENPSKFISHALGFFSWRQHGHLVDIGTVGCSKRANK